MPNQTKTAKSSTKPTKPRGEAYSERAMIFISREAHTALKVHSATVQISMKELVDRIVADFLRSARTPNAEKTGR